MPRRVRRRRRGAGGGLREPAQGAGGYSQGEVPGEGRAKDIEKCLFVRFLYQNIPIYSDTETREMCLIGNILNNQIRVTKKTKYISSSIAYSF